MGRKKKTVDSDDIYEKMAAETGGEVLGKSAPVKYFVDTGSLVLNYICSGKFIDGGIPSGKVSEVYGPNSSAKSLIAMNVLKGVQKLDGFAIILDCENATNADFAEKASHIDVNKVLRYTPLTLEKSFLKIHNVIKYIRAAKGDDVPIVIVYDSIASSPCERELKEADLPDNYNAAQWKKIVGGKSQPGERAKVCSAEFRKLISVLEKTNATVFITNQIRDKIGVLWGSPETTGGGGNALPFYASLRLRTQAAARIKKKIGGIEIPIGVDLKIKNVKNRSFRPFAETDGMKLFFESGINPLSGLLKALIQDERIVSTGQARWGVCPEYLPEGLEEYKFGSTLTRNDVPAELLLDCPAIIGAKDRGQVEEYLKDFVGPSVEDIEENDEFFEEIEKVNPEELLD